MWLAVGASRRAPYAHRGFDRKAEVGVLIIEFNTIPATTKTYSLLAEACCNGSTQSRRGDDLLVQARHDGSPEQRVIVVRLGAHRRAGLTCVE